MESARLSRCGPGYKPARGKLCRGWSSWARSCTGGCSSVSSWDSVRLSSSLCSPATFLHLSTLLLAGMCGLFPSKMERRPSNATVHKALLVKQELTSLASEWRAERKSRMCFDQCQRAHCEHWNIFVTGNFC